MKPKIAGLTLAYIENLLGALCVGAVNRTS